jgi:hypothetical protein
METQLRAGLEGPALQGPAEIALLLIMSTRHALEGGYTAVGESPHVATLGFVDRSSNMHCTGYAGLARSRPAELAVLLITSMRNALQCVGPYMAIGRFKILPSHSTKFSAEVSIDHATDPGPEGVCNVKKRSISFMKYQTNNSTNLVRHCRAQ